MNPLTSLFGFRAAASSQEQSLVPSTPSMVTPASSIVAHAAAEGGKIKMYSPEYYQACAVGG